MTERPEPIFGQETLNLDTEVTLLMPLTEAEPYAVVLPPFTGARSCVKCTGENPTLSHHKGASTSQPCWAIYYEIPWGASGPVVPMPEHFDRRCRVCGYAWVEDIRREGDDSEQWGTV